MAGVEKVRVGDEFGEFATVEPGDAMSIKEVTFPRFGEVVLLPSGEDGSYA